MPLPPPRAASRSLDALWGNGPLSVQLCPRSYLLVFFFGPWPLDEVWIQDPQPPVLALLVSAVLGREKESVGSLGGGLSSWDQAHFTWVLSCSLLPSHTTNMQKHAWFPRGKMPNATLTQAGATIGRCSRQQLSYPNLVGLRV